MSVDRKKLRAQLSLHEGREKKLYKDTVGKWTIGVGRNLSDRGLSDEEIDFLLDNDIDDHLLELETALPWIVDLDEVRQRVLADMAFNLGVPKLLGFKQTLAAIRRQDFWMASVGMMNSKWSDDVGDGWGGMFDRAERLAQMMRTGVDYTK
jgi:lysozyme